MLAIRASCGTSRNDQSRCRQWPPAYDQVGDLVQQGLADAGQTTCGYTRVSHSIGDSLASELWICCNIGPVRMSR